MIVYNYGGDDNMCKKLYADFTIKEKEILSEVLKKNSNKPIDICYHAKKRMEEKGIEPKDIIEALKSFKIIELHLKDGDVRILIRGEATNDSNKNTCMSLSLSNMRIITVYQNCSMDGHKTLVRDNYEDFNVEDILKDLFNKIN